MRHTRLLTILCVCLILPPGCTTFGRLPKHREQVRHGLLTTGLHRDAFLAEWGYPTRTATLTGEEMVEARMFAGRGSFSKSRRAYDVWEYPDREVTLVFSGARLVAWETDKTVEQLSSGHQAQPEAVDPGDARETPGGLLGHPSAGGAR